MSMRKDSESSEIEISNDIEQLLASKINECFTNEKFPELQISVIYRAVKKSSKEKGAIFQRLFGVFVLFRPLHKVWLVWSHALFLNMYT